jgi:bis(5'-nucleosyl)-tetraphosphatase (symmetrical)
MNWLIGDLQGCDSALVQLLQELDFSPSRDQLWLLGDLIGRGPDSLRCLRRVRDLGAKAVLGNHDLNLLAIAAGHRKAKRSDQLEPLLQAPDFPELLDWLRQQAMVREAHGWLLVHAGLLPSWDANHALALAREVETVLQDPQHLAEFLPVMMGNRPVRWDETLQGADRLRFLVNAFTRLRFVAIDGSMDFEAKEGAGSAPEGLMPWFEHPARASQNQPIAFGHWSTLGLIDRPDLLSLDTGCVWGGCLTAARIDGGRREIKQVHCVAAQKPGLV